VTAVSLMWLIQMTARPLCALAKPFFPPFFLPFDELPFALQLHVLAFLPAEHLWAMTRVSHHWCQLIWDCGTTLWTGVVNLQSLAAVVPVTLQFFHPFLLRGTWSRLRGLNLTDCPLMTNYPVARVVSLLPALEALGLRRTGISNNGLHELAQCVPTRLAALDLGGLNINAFGMRPFMCACPSLTALALAACSRVDDEVIDVVTACVGTRLRLLDLSCCFRTTNVGMSMIAERCPLLEALNLAEGMADDERPVRLDIVDDPSMAMPSVAMWPSAVRVDQLPDVVERWADAWFVHSPTSPSIVTKTRPRPLSEAGIKAVVCGCPRLRVLSLAFCGGVTGAMVLSLQALRSVRRVSFDWVTPMDWAALDAFVLAVPTLRVVSLRLCGMGAVMRRRLHVRSITCIEDAEDLAAPSLTDPDIDLEV
jgi:hypothetical protein